METDRFMVLSPDGSLRNKSGEILTAIEIKCPYPGKSFTIPVNY